MLFRYERQNINAFDIMLRRVLLQEWPQVESARQFCKFAARPTSLRHIPIIVEKAIRCSLYGRPGPCYIDLPGDLLGETINETDLSFGSPIRNPPPLASPPVNDLESAAKLLISAKKPLVIVGKGAAYARAEKPLTKLVSRCHLPFLPTPMGKGVVSDLHPNCVAPARSFALRHSDVILLVGAR